MEEVYRSTRDIDEAAKKLVSSFYDENPYYFLSPEIFLDVYRQMVRHIATCHRRESLELVTGYSAYRFLLIYH